jgi:abortive infection bacteriophage resistance protein
LINHPKNWLSYDEQLDRLIERGMKVTHREKALDYLERLGYYRLSGYWFDFRQRSEICCPVPKQKNKKGKPKTDRLALDNFKDGACFKDVIALYVFDKKLRLLVMDAIERIEIALRVDIAHLLGQYSSISYLDKTNFHEGFSLYLDASKGVTKHHEWLSKHAQLINRSREAFIVHNKQKYGLPLADLGSL